MSEGVPVTRRLAEFCEDLVWTDLPEQVQEHLKLCILDTLGCGLFGSTVPWGRILIDFAAEDEGRAAEATLWGDGRKVPAHAAALANGTLGHSFEIDDLHKVGVIHPGSAVIPAVLALAERSGGSVSGERFLAAVAAGYEAGCRLGVATGAITLANGYHSSAVAGAVAAGVGAARVLELHRDTFLHAVGIAGTQASGLMAAQYNSYVKRAHQGRAAESGVYGALLARRGLTGIVDLLEAPYGGFCSTMAKGSDPEEIIRDLGSRWESAASGFKPYSCCGSNHTSIDAVLTLKGELPELNGETVDGVTVFCTPTTLHHVGWEYRPESVTSAQMNLSYAVAVCLQDGQVFVDQYTSDRISRPDTVALTKKVRIVETDEFSSLGRTGRHGVRVVARMNDGRTAQCTVLHAKGSAHYPMTRKEVIEKFTSLAGKVLPRGQVAELLEAVLHLEAMADVSSLAGLLVPKRN